MSKNKLINSVLTVLFALVQIASLAASSQFAPTATQTATSTPFPTATLTQTPLPTDTATPTPTATAIPPSPTPPGFIKFNNGGFSLIYPSGWNITSQTDTGFTAKDDITDEEFIATSNTSNQTQTVPQMVNTFTKSLGQYYGSTIIQTGQVVLGNNVKAEAADLLIKFGNVRTSAKVTFVHQGNRDYTFAFLCPYGTIDMYVYQTDLQNIYISIHLFSQ